MINDELSKQIREEPDDSTALTRKPEPRKNLGAFSRSIAASMTKEEYGKWCDELERCFRTQVS